MKLSGVFRSGHHKNASIHLSERRISTTSRKSLQRFSTSECPLENDCIRVIIRVRPQSETEILKGCQNVIQVLDEKLLVFDPKAEATDFYFKGKKQLGRDMAKRPNKDIKFVFDKVFDCNATNEEVYQDTTKTVIDGVLNGFNCSVFAYGATGSGKTYTMIGSTTNPGITFLTVMDLYRRIEEVKEEKLCEVSVSYLEIYNESIKDLLKPSSPLMLREDPQLGVVVSGLSFHKPKGAEELLGMLEFGNRNRTQHCTDANSESSRSHAVFQVYVKQQDKTATISSSVKVAKMSLIDLAGSERACVASGHNGRLREGANINKSLLALGNCINALADKMKKGQHIPYRNSKLTRILKDSLGGNCQTVMIANISPSSASYEDTYNTLRYADRAKSIQLSITSNVMKVDAHLSQYKTIVEQLHKQIEDLKAKLSGSNQRSSVAEIWTQTDILFPIIQTDSLSPDVSSVTEIKESSTDTLELNNLLSDQKKIRKKLLECESSLRRLELKTIWKGKYLDRIAAFSVDTSNLNKSTAKLSLTLRSLKNKENRLRMLKLELEKELYDNIKMCKECKENLLNDESKYLNKAVTELVEKKHLDIEVSDLRHHLKHLQHVANFQQREVDKAESLLKNAFKLMQLQHLLLKGHGFMTEELQVEYESILHHAEGGKEVSWPDQKQQNETRGCDQWNFVMALPVLSTLQTSEVQEPPSDSLVTVFTSPSSPNAHSQAKEIKINVPYPTKELSSCVKTPFPSASNNSPAVPLTTTARRSLAASMNFEHKKDSVFREINKTLQLMSPAKNNGFGCLNRTFSASPMNNLERTEQMAKLPDSCLNSTFSTSNLLRNCLKSSNFNDGKDNPTPEFAKLSVSKYKKSSSLSSLAEENLFPANFLGSTFQQQQQQQNRTPLSMKNSFLEPYPSFPFSQNGKFFKQNMTAKKSSFITKHHSDKTLGFKMRRFQNISDRENLAAPYDRSHQYGRKTPAKYILPTSNIRNSKKMVISRPRFKF